MKILFILDEFLPEDSSGTTIVAFNLARGLIKKGHELLVLTATHDPDNEREMAIDNVNIKVLFTKPFGKFRNWKNWKNNSLLTKTETFLEYFKPDIVHIHALHHRFSWGIIGLAKKYAMVFLTLHDAQAVYNGKLYPKRKICNLDPVINYKVSRFDSFRKDGLAYNPLQKNLIKKSLKKADKIFAVSHALKQALEVNGIQNMETIHNGIDASEWSGKAGEEGYILLAGRIDNAKGLSVLLQAFEIVRTKVEDAKLTLVGGYENIKQKNVIILPWQSRSEMKKIFENSKIVVVPSIYLDPFPTVNLEAMACKKPVVATCFGGSREVVLDGKTGYIVNPYNTDELANKIIDLLKNPEKAKQFGEAGHERIKSEFNLEKMTNDYLYWYNIQKE